VNPHEIKGANQTKPAFLEVSPDNRLVAFLYDNGGDERYTLYIRDIINGQLLSDRIPNVGAMEPRTAIQWGDSCTVS
jgi:protease II